MGLFRKATRTAGRVAKNVAKEAVFGDLENEGGSKKGRRKGGVAKTRERREYEEYKRLKEKFEPKDDATMQAEWQKYYDEQCEGECETCPYYDWCPDDFEDEEEAVEEQAEKLADQEEEPERGAYRRGEGRQGSGGGVLRGRMRRRMRSLRAL